MSYKPTRYADIDLMLKTDRAMSSTFDAVVQYAQQALNDLGIKPGLKVDGKFGPKTRAGVQMFQEACGLPVTGILDQMTYDQLDWRVYGELNGSWTPCPVTVTNVSPRGPAIVKGFNKYVVPPLRVNIVGACREGQHLSDVQEAFVGRALGHEGAVDRNTAFGKRSRHALSIAGDDMGDQNSDRIVDASEILQRKAAWDYLVMRAQGFRAESYILTTIDTRESTSYRGRDRLSILTLGNLKVNGKPIFPELRAMRDVSWSAVRNTPKGLSTTIHVAPFHLHSDCLPGAPEGSPW